MEAFLAKNVAVLQRVTWAEATRVRVLNLAQEEELYNKQDKRISCTVTLAHFIDDSGNLGKVRKEIDDAHFA